MSTLQRLERHACFGGWQDVYEHASVVNACTMRFGIYLPPQAATRRCPVIYWLSGLTCTEQNFITKAGAQRYAAEHGVIIVTPDTSPRGEHVPDDEAFDLGQGAGFYVNATQAPWSANYRMYDYVVAELPALIEREFPASDRRSVCGHSMGGHGALVVGLRNPDRYAAVSALAAIVNPTAVPWGRKELAAYLGDDESHWAAYDATHLVRARAAAGAAPLPEILLDQGDADPYLGVSLTPDTFVTACAEAGQPLELRRQREYDHSYYFVATFIGDHIARHAKALHA